MVKTAVAKFGKEAIVKALLKAVLAATVTSIAVTIIEADDDDYFASVMGLIFKGVVGATLLAGAIFDAFKAHGEIKGEKDDPITRKAGAAALALTGLLIELFGGDLLGALLDTRGITNVFQRGVAMMLLDFLGFGLAFWGFWKLLSKLPAVGTLLQHLRSTFVVITDSIEDAITFFAWVGSVAAITANFATGKYWEGLLDEGGP